jgi:hypothetical protein
VLTTVNIDTASSGGVVTADGAGGKNHELTLPGLVDPHQYVTTRDPASLAR